MDDQGSIEKWQCPTSKKEAVQSSAGRVQLDEELAKMNVSCLRRFVNTFLAFYRTMHLWEVRESVEPPATNGGDASDDCGICLHHVVAASDEFSKLSMHWDMMPAAKLNYVHDFKGFFNCISQVAMLVFFTLHVYARMT